MWLRTSNATVNCLCVLSVHAKECEEKKIFPVKLAICERDMCTTDKIDNTQRFAICHR